MGSVRVVESELSRESQNSGHGGGARINGTRHRFLFPGVARGVDQRLGKRDSSSRSSPLDVDSTAFYSTDDRIGNDEDEDEEG
jgi:hypothetical protein